MTDKHDSINNPYIVNPNGLTACIITEGENKGLPLAVAYLIGEGKLDREEVKHRGWKYDNQ